VPIYQAVWSHITEGSNFHMCYFSFRCDVRTRDLRSVGILRNVEW